MIKRFTFNKFIVYLLLTIAAVISLLPLYWVFSTSLQLSSYQDEDMERPVSYVNSTPPKMYPVGITEYFEHWRKARNAEKEGDSEQAAYHREIMDEIVTDTFSGFRRLFTQNSMGAWFFNSVYISVVVTIGILLFDSMAGYVLAKKKFPGRDVIFWLIISTMMIPGQVTLVPMFIMVSELA